MTEGPSELGPFEIPVSKILSNLDPNSDQWADPQVLAWIKEVMTDQRGYEATIRIRDVRPNPFVTHLNEQLVDAHAEEIKSLERTAHLFVARLPDGTYVDVDTPHDCEATRRSGIAGVRATVIGTFTKEDCQRIGLQIGGERDKQSESSSPPSPVEPLEDEPPPRERGRSRALIQPIVKPAMRALRLIVGAVVFAFLLFLGWVAVEAIRDTDHANPNRARLPSGLEECQSAASATDGVVQGLLDADPQAVRTLRSDLRRLVRLDRRCAPFARGLSAPEVVRACAAVNQRGAEMLDWMIRIAQWSGPPEDAEVMINHVTFDLYAPYRHALDACFA